MSSILQRLVLIIPFIVVWIGFARAQVDAQWIDTVEVSLSRIPLSIAETGRHITTISADEIAEIPNTSIDDLLQYIPGIEVQSRNAFGAQGDISMRGSTFSQVLVLIDGMRLNDPLTAHFNSNIPVSLAEIEKIEVLRGAAAATFGADAVGGVINIVTKVFGKAAKENVVQGNFNLGENRLVKATQGFFHKKDNMVFSGGVDIAQSTGESISFDPILNLESFDNFFDVKTLGAAFGYTFNDKLKLRTRIAYDYRDFSARYFYTNSNFDKSVETVSNWWNHLQLEHIADKSSTRFNLAYKNNTDVFVFSPDFPSTNEHTTQLLNFNIQHLRQISDEFTLNFGIDADQRKIESTDRGNHKDFHIGAYALAVFRPTYNLFINTSLRIDNDENYGSEFSPNINIAWRLDMLTFRGSTGRSIRAADFTERYVSYNLQNLSPGRSRGNANLNAENSWSHEIGIDLQLSPYLLFTTTGYLRNSSSLIDYVPTIAAEIFDNENLLPGEFYLFAENITDVTTKGLELAVTYRKQFSERFSLNMQMSFTTIETENDEDIISVYISNHAKALFQTNLLFEIGKLNLGINGLIKKRNERAAEGVAGVLEDQYGLWNLNGTWSLNTSLGLRIQVHNLFDKTYQDILGAPMPGRWIMGGFTYNL